MFLRDADEIAVALRHISYHMIHISCTRQHCHQTANQRVTFALSANELLSKYECTCMRSALSCWQLVQFFFQQKITRISRFVHFAIYAHIINLHSFVHFALCKSQSCTTPSHALCFSDLHLPTIALPLLLLQIVGSSLRCVCIAAHAANTHLS